MRVVARFVVHEKRVGQLKALLAGLADQMVIDEISIKELDSEQRLRRSGDEDGPRGQPAEAVEPETGEHHEHAGEDGILARLTRKVTRRKK